MRVLIVVFLIGINLFAYETWIKEGYYKSYDYEKMGSYQEAIKSLSLIYQKYPKAYTPNYRLGWLYYLNKNYNNAITHYQKAIIALPNSLEVRNKLTLVYLSQRKYKEAQSNAYEVLKKDYYNYYANLYFVSSLIGQKKYELAKEVVNKMLIVYPTDIYFLENLAYLYLLENSMQKATIVYEDIITLDPNNILANKYLSNKGQK